MEARREDVAADSWGMSCQQAVQATLLYSRIRAAGPPAMHGHAIFSARNGPAGGGLTHLAQCSGGASGEGQQQNVGIGR